MGNNLDSAPQTGDHISVNITKIVSEIKNKIETIPLSHCICKVPEKRRVGNEDAYSPKLVSIGPFHHGKSTLEEMEHHKWRYLNTILTRKPNLEATLDSCVKALKELEGRARNSYGEEIRIGSDEFVRMMLVDGCFIIELLLRTTTKSSRRRDDPLLISNEKLNHLRRDILLLENQIPFFVLQHLFYTVPIPQQCKQTLTELALRFFRIMIPGQIEDLQEKFSWEVRHLLDLVRTGYLPTYSKLHSTGNAQKEFSGLKKLQRDGIRIRRFFDAESLLNIRFVKGSLWIPPLRILNHTEILMRNLIALEACCCDSKPITSYAFLLKSLIQTTEDAKFLCRRGVLSSSLDKKEEVRALFDELCSEVDLQESSYSGIFQKVDEYTHKNRRRWRIQPTVAGFVLAVLFIVLTIIGTIFSVLAFCFHRS
ncbi:UPF0481 protein At3g47200-like [Malania oleifera]|uniref:UPF0481 protein At3g47200-like n=1 Tax=Malania oleifera TaxID=397392 RepID=UPI0025AE462D|nr:UPF0481 protein At3g47200-like [Malania oleifera]